MTLDLSNEAILKQLGVTSINDALLNQISTIRENTNKFEHIEKHIFDLHKSLEKIEGYVAISNTKDYLKIKHHDGANRVQNAEFDEMVKHWAERYKIAVEKVDGKPTYYILGLNH